ncbi:aldo/keto reductase [Actinomadura hibisca]|uniref:aldo/keto reductase n=1 Tax=Actinomadura hibisca TaxID=68565 RepID=UPI0008350BDF|nr:aldo/keto reductase [Actinomadura hibisca]
MTAQLGLGTYRCRDVTAAAQAAVTAGVGVIDTAPVYAAGTAQRQLGPLLRHHPDVRVTTKIGHMTTAQAEDARKANAITAHEAARRHCISPRYIVHQLAANRAELCRERLDLVYLHNPEHHANGDRAQLLTRLTASFEVFEQAAHAGHITGYGVATWIGLSSRAFTITDLITAARAAAGGSGIHLRAVQFPVNLVQLRATAEALHGRGPIIHAEQVGLEVWASAPLHGGELVGMVNGELAAAIDARLSPVQAALAVVGSTPGLTGAFLSASTAAHWNEALSAFAQPPLSPEHLEAVCRVLRAH